VQTLNVKLVVCIVTTDAHYHILSMW